MKKFLVVLLILAVAGGVFAQELKLNGYVNTGLMLTVFDSDLDKTPTLSTYGYDAGQPAYRFRLNGQFGVENMGVKFRFQAQGITNTGGNNTAASVPYAFGWINILNNMIQINGGLIDDGTYNSMGDWDSDGGEGMGALVNFKPIKDLSIGLGVYTEPFGATPHAIAYDAMKFTGNVAFTMPDTFKLTAVYAMDNLQDYTPPGAGKVSVSNYKQISGGLSILAISNLKLVIEGAGRIYDVGTKTYTPGMIVETIAFKADKLDVGITGYEYFNGRPFWADNPDKKNPAWDDAYVLTTAADTHDITFGWTAEPWVSYSFGKIVPKIAYKIGMDNFESGLLDATLTEMRLKPSIKFNLPAGSFIEVAYEWYRVSASGKNNGGNDIPDDANRYLNRAYVDFVWKF